MPKKVLITLGTTLALNMATLAMAQSQDNQSANQNATGATQSQSSAQNGNTDSSNSQDRATSENSPNKSSQDKSKDADCGEGVCASGACGG